MKRDYTRLDDDWIRCISDGWRLPVDIRPIEEGGRVVISGFRIDVDHRIDTTMLNEVRFGLLEADLNSAHGELLRMPFPGIISFEARPLPELKVPTTHPYGDDFYRSVAEAYNSVVSSGKPPAPAIAAATGVKAPQVHNWIREARRRGFLAPPQHGRAG